jgi:hypothetical protein
MTAGLDVCRKQFGSVGVEVRRVKST